MATETPTSPPDTKRIAAQTTVAQPVRVVAAAPVRWMNWASSRQLLRRTIPSWMLSSFVHLLILMVLALTYLQAPGGSAETFISIAATHDEPQVEAFQRPDELNPVNRMSPSLSSVPQAKAEQREEIPEIVLAEDVSAAPSRVALSNFSDRTIPRQELLHGVGALAAEALSGRGGHVRGKMIAEYGGSEGSERAVARALRWFAEHQRRDGSWSLDHRDGPCEGRCSQHGAMQRCFTGGTALALLPFLGAGQTHEQGKYKKQVEAGIQYLLKTQGRPNGSLVSGGGSLYSHGLASIALCEAYAMTHDHHLQEPAQAAVRYIAYAQDPVGGGWRYLPRQPGDTSVVGWQLMALKSGHMGQLKVPAFTVRGVSKFLDSVQVDGGSIYGYTSPRVDRPSMTAVGLLCRMYLGWKKDNPALQRGVQRLANHGPAPNEEHTNFHMYYNFYATQVLRHHGGPAWEEWNEVMREMLVRQQKMTGHEAGSWDIPDWEGSGSHDTENGGRLYYTSLATMILEVYYRYMPIYREQAAQDDFPL